MRDRPTMAPWRWAIGMACACALSTVACGGPSRQDDVAERGRDVMPFDLDATTHEFVGAPDGGVQTVTSDVDDPRQVALVRRHLRAEAAAFRAGDFEDPATIHGHDMPGLVEMVDGAGTGAISITYEEVDDGARLTYTTDDPALVDAVHRWFDAQVGDHGGHATGS